VIEYTTEVAEVTTEQLEGFFVGWPKPPTPETHLRLLRGSDHVVLAIDDETGSVVGFVTAVTDGVLSAYIPLLEVLPAHKGKGIGRGLVARLLEGLRGYYMIDLVCDQELQPFYERFGFGRAAAMVIRDRERQGGRQ
jgi:predicted N-acetyltransferase YhbS